MREFELGQFGSVKFNHLKFKSLRVVLLFNFHRLFSSISEQKSLSYWPLTLTDSYALPALRDSVFGIASGVVMGGPHAQHHEYRFSNPSSEGLWI